MTISPVLWQFIGSLAAILIIAWLVRRIGLGAPPQLKNDAQAIAAAGEVFDGYAPILVARDANGKAALLQDAQGQVMLIKQHGNQFAGRILSANSRAVSKDRGIVVDSGEARFGVVPIDLNDAEPWVAAINRIE